MGWSDLLYANPITALPYGLYKNFGQGGGASPADKSNGADTYIPYSSSDQEGTLLANKIYNTEGARNYGNVFDQAYQNLGQPLHDAPHEVNGQTIGDRDKVYVAGTRALATSFVDRFHQKTGQLPSEDQVKQFVAQSLTPSFAQKFIVGMPPEQITSMADDHIAGNPDLLPGNKNALQDQVEGLQRYADQQYRTGADLLSKDVQDQYVGQKRGLVEDLASQNQLGQANSRYSLDNLEAQKNKTMEQGLTQLANQRAQTGTNLGLQGTQMGLQNQQFGSQLGLATRQQRNNEDVMGQNLALQNRQLQQASEMGRLQAGSQSNNGLAGGLGGAIGGAQAGTAIMPGWGTAIGGLAGGLGGYFGTRR